MRQLYDHPQITNGSTGEKPRGMAAGLTPSRGSQKAKKKCLSLDRHSPHWGCIKKTGDFLLSRHRPVSSALGTLTSVFGMGTGISSPPWPPAFILNVNTDTTTEKGNCKKAEQKDNMAKPHALLVPLGCARRRACTCGLSTRYSPGGLQGSHAPGEISSRGGLPA